MSKNLARSSRETCIYCGEPFTRVTVDYLVENKDNNFCSDNCRAQYPNKPRDDERRT